MLKSVVGHVAERMGDVFCFKRTCAVDFHCVTSTLAWFVSHETLVNGADIVARGQNGRCAVVQFCTQLSHRAHRVHEGRERHLELVLHVLDCSILVPVYISTVH